MAIVAENGCFGSSTQFIPLPEVQSFESIFDYLLTIPEVDFLDTCIRISGSCPEHMNPLYSDFAS